MVAAEHFSVRGVKDVAYLPLQLVFAVNGRHAHTTLPDRATALAAVRKFIDRLPHPSEQAMGRFWLDELPDPLPHYSIAAGESWRVSIQGAFRTQGSLPYNA